MLTKDSKLASVSIGPLYTDRLPSSHKKRWGSYVRNVKVKVPNQPRASKGFTRTESKLERGEREQGLRRAIQYKYRPSHTQASRVQEGGEAEEWEVG